MKKVGLFQEAPGVNSITRVAFGYLLLWGSIQTTVGLMVQNWPVGEAIAFFSAVAGVATGGKLIQKAMEPKQPGEVTP